MSKAKVYRVAVFEKKKPKAREVYRGSSKQMAAMTFYHVAKRATAGSEIWILENNKVLKKVRAKAETKDRQLVLVP